MPPCLEGAEGVSELPCFFDKFSRCLAATQNVVEAGLGLALIRSLVQHH